MSSRKATVSLTSSTAVWTMSSQASARPVSSSALRRQNGLVGQLARIVRGGRASRDLSATQRVERAVAIGHGAVACGVARTDRARASRPGSGAARDGTARPRARRRSSRRRPCQLALDAPLRRIACIRSQPARSDSSRGSGSGPGAVPSQVRRRWSSTSSHAVTGCGVSPSSRATSVLSHSRSVRRPSIAMAWCSGPSRGPVRTVRTAARASASPSLARAATS